MKPKLSITYYIMIITVITVACNQQVAKDEASDQSKEAGSVFKFGGFESQVKWGEHLVVLGG
ncbi:MAG: hypothetical protein ABI861_14180, partial [Panacibacter sp.]